MYLSVQHAARWCYALLPLMIPLLSIYPIPTVGVSSKPLVHRLFTVADSYPTVEDDFRLMSVMIAALGFTWGNFHLARTTYASGHAMMCAHLAAGLHSFDQYGKRTKYVACPATKYKYSLELDFASLNSANI